MALVREDEQQKKSKVVSCDFTKEYDGKFGKVYYHVIKFENGDVGEAGFKSMSNDYFTPNRVVDYVIYKTTRSDGITKDTRIAKPNSPYEKKAGGFTKSAKTFKMEAVSQAMGHAVDAAAINPEGDISLIPGYFDKFYEAMAKKIDAIDGSQS